MARARCSTACRALGTGAARHFRQLARGLWRRLAAGVGDDTPLRPQTSYGAPRRWASCWSTITAARAISTAARCAFPPSSCGPAGPTAPPRAGLLDLPRAARGAEVVCPVRAETTMAILSPRRLIAAIEQLHDLPPERFGADRSLLLPAISASPSPRWSLRSSAPAARRCVGVSTGSRIPAIQNHRRWLAARADGAARAESRHRGRPRLDAIVAAFVADDLRRATGDGGAAGRMTWRGAVWRAASE